MRIGFVRVLHEYVVDLDDPEAVERAKRFLKSDLCQMAVHPDREADLDRAIGTRENGSEETIDDDNLDELAGNQIYFTSDPVQFLRDDRDYGSCGEDLWEDPGGHVVSTEDAIEMERMTLLGDSIRYIQGR